MYGLVHQGLRDLIIHDYGDAAWESVKQASNLSEHHFISMESYDDADTFKVVTAALDVLHISLDKLLEDFGVYWVTYSANSSYGELFDMAGRTLPEFLKNLDMLHVRVSTMMPNLVPPSFECSHETDHSMDVAYYSERQGLAPMVTGLIKGLGIRFHTPCTVSITQTAEQTGDPTLFHVTWQP